MYRRDIESKSNNNDKYPRGKGGVDMKNGVCMGGAGLSIMELENSRGFGSVVWRNIGKGKNGGNC